VAAAPRGELVAAAEATRIRVWSLREPKPVAAWPLPPPSGLALAFSPDGRTLAAGHAGRTVALFDPLTGQCRAEYDFGVGPVHSLAYAPDGMTLAVAGRNGLVVVDAE
jgi:WD40 repeat protein